MACPLECEFLRESRKHEKRVTPDGLEFPNRDIEVSEKLLRANEALLWLDALAPPGKVRAIMPAPTTPAAATPAVTFITRARPSSRTRAFARPCSSTGITCVPLGRPPIRLPGKAGILMRATCQFGHDPGSWAAQIRDEDDRRR